ncbi:PIG-L family deacetylase [soil metagenome]
MLIRLQLNASEPSGALRHTGPMETTPVRAAHHEHRPVVMVFHAHPDDESSQTGGTLARYAALGYRTVLVTCTDGSRGDAAGGHTPVDPGHDPRAVARWRAGELDRAAAILGIADVVKLGYPDSGMSPDDAEAADGQTVFSRLPVKPLVGAAVRLMRMFRPDVVVTYPPNGLSEHPDHIRTHDIVVAAHRNIVASADWGPPEAPGPRLFYIAVPRSHLDVIRRAAHAALGPEAWVPPDSLAVDDASITTVIDVADFWDQKLRALSAHASQRDAAGLATVFSSITASEFGGRAEHYVRIYPAPEVVSAGLVDDDLFPGQGHDSN